ncbi:MAG: peptidoglycan DD-metalloendopeptidase family protein [Hyphomicrobiales bacterium]|nr:peptidoglycan DD-metalloendopeptidase family protein [Hyphomicrobiales bacterium]
MMYSQFSLGHRVFVNRVASVSVVCLAILLGGCSGQGVSYSDLQSERYQEHKSASAPIPSEPVYGHNNSEAVAAVARYQQTSIESRQLAPVRVASLDHNYVGSSYAIQPVQASQQTGNTGPSGARYAQAGPGYYPQRDYRHSRPESYQDSDYDREEIPERYEAEQYLRKDDYRRRTYSSENRDYYTVVSGDTLYSLARRFDMTTAELAELNGIVGSKIYAGQKLRVGRKPVYTASNRYELNYDPRDDNQERSYAAPKRDPYDERRGFEYEERKSPPPARRSYSSYDDYKVQNSRPWRGHERSVQGYDDGEEERDIYRKSYSKPSGRYEKYTVRRGDSLYSIARYFRLNYRELAYYNDIPVSGTLYPGQVLHIPDQRGEVSGYDRKDRHDEEDYSERKAPPRQNKQAEADEDLPYWKRRSASRPVSQSGKRQEIASAENGVSTPEVIVDEGEDKEEASNRSERPSSQKGKPVLAAHSDVKAAGLRPKQVQASVGECNDLLENPMPRSSKTFREPVEGLIVARFGATGDKTMNDGVDFSVPKGTPVKAAENGVVAYTGDELPGFGKLVLVRHADGYVTAYAHNDELLVDRCDVVKRGQVISRAGATGKVTKPLLHFEIRKDAKPVDPEAYFARS